MADTKASSTPIEALERIRAIASMASSRSVDAIAEIRADYECVREALERAPAGVGGPSETFAWGVEYPDGYRELAMSEAIAEQIAVDGIVGRKHGGNGVVVPLYRAPVGGDAPMSEVARALALYEADPVDNRDRPSSWGKLDALLGALRRAALSTRSEEVQP